MAEQKKIPKRSEVRKEDTWALEDLFATDELWFEEIRACEKYVDIIRSYKGKLKEDANMLLEYFRMDTELSLKLSALGNYCYRKADEDMANGFYKDMCGKYSELCTKLSAASSFDTVEILDIDDITLEMFFDKEPALKEYSRNLYLIRRSKDHVLSEKEEALLSEVGQISGAGSDISATLRNADMKFRDATDKDGNSYPLSNASFSALIKSEDRVLRKSAFENMYAGYSSLGNTLASCFDAQAKKLKFYSKIRNHASTIDAALFYTEVPVSVYHNLIKTVNDKLPYMYKYIELRKKLLGLDELHMYDLYTPIVSGVDKSISYEEAKETVVKALAPLGEEYIAYLKKGFNERWIDIYENEGKRSGAYSAGASPHPYVLLNYGNTLNDQFTLAHEMGHALHSYYSRKIQPPQTASYVIFVAEVASTCNEILLMKYLLAHTEDKQEKIYLINYFLEQFKSTVYRQTMFAEFELEINRFAEEGNTLTKEALNKKYYALVKKYHGDGITLDDEIKWEWSRIPHFYMNYYVFQYATGFSAAAALAEKILEEGEPAVKRYLSFLSSGGSKDPISLLRDAGVDMSSSEPIEKALDLFSDLIDEADALTE